MHKKAYRRCRILVFKGIHLIYVHEDVMYLLCYSGSTLPRDSAILYKLHIAIFGQLRYFLDRTNFRAIFNTQVCSSAQEPFVM